MVLLLLLLLLLLKPYKFIHAYYHKSLFVWCVSRKIHVMRGNSCDHSNNVAFCYFLSFFGPPMPCLFEEKLPTHLTELPSIVVSITVMIFFHIILHPAVLIYDFHIFTTSELPFVSQHFLHFLTKHGKKLVGLKGWPSLADM